ncbi:hypothetical protein PCE1_002210 [Barthelona sp. PCE]
MYKLLDVEPSAGIVLGTSELKTELNEPFFRLRLKLQEQDTDKIQYRTIEVSPDKMAEFRSIFARLILLRKKLIAMTYFRAERQTKEQVARAIQHRCETYIARLSVVVMETLCKVHEADPAGKAHLIEALPSYGRGEYADVMLSPCVLSEDFRGWLQALGEDECQQGVDKVLPAISFSLERFRELANLFGMRPSKSLAKNIEESDIRGVREMIRAAENHWKAAPALITQELDAFTAAKREADKIEGISDVDKKQLIKTITQQVTHAKEQALNETRKQTMAAWEEEPSDDETDTQHTSSNAGMNTAMQIARDATALVSETMKEARQSRMRATTYNEPFDAGIQQDKLLRKVKHQWQRGLTYDKFIAAMDKFLEAEIKRNPTIFAGDIDLGLWKVDDVLPDAFVEEVTDDHKDNWFREWQIRLRDFKTIYEDKVGSQYEHEWQTKRLYLLMEAAAEMALGDTLLLIGKLYEERPHLIPTFIAAVSPYGPSRANRASGIYNDELNVDHVPDNWVDENRVKQFLTKTLGVGSSGIMVEFDPTATKKAFNHSTRAPKRTHRPKTQKKKQAFSAKEEENKYLSDKGVGDANDPNAVTALADRVGELSIENVKLKKEIKSLKKEIPKKQLKAAKMELRAATKLVELEDKRLEAIKARERSTQKTKAPEDVKREKPRKEKAPTATSVQKMISKEINKLKHEVVDERNNVQISRNPKEVVGTDTMQWPAAAPPVALLKHLPPDIFQKGGPSQRVLKEVVLGVTGTWDILGTDQMKINSADTPTEQFVRDAARVAGLSCEEIEKTVRLLVTEGVTRDMVVIEGKKPRRQEPVRHWYKDDAVELNLAVTALKSKDLIKEVPIEEIEDERRAFISIGAVPKNAEPDSNNMFAPTQKFEFDVTSPDNEHRVIVDCTNTNSMFANIPMELIKTHSLEIVMGGNLMYSVDAKDGFTLIPLDEELQKLFSFTHEGKLYQCTRMPFGVSFGPAIFARMMNLATTAMRALGFNIWSYVDDAFGWERSLSKARNSMMLFIIIASKLGIKLNYKISTIRPSDKNIRKIREMARVMRNRIDTAEQIPVRDIMKLDGKLVSFANASTILQRVHLQLQAVLKDLDAQYDNAIFDSSRNKGLRLLLPLPLADALTRIVECNFEPKTLSCGRAKVTLLSDAMKDQKHIGIGAKAYPDDDQELSFELLHRMGVNEQGARRMLTLLDDLPEQERVDIEQNTVATIAEQEMVPIVELLKTKGRQLRNTEVVWYCDNTNVCAAVAKGYSKNKVLNKGARIVMELCEMWDVIVTPIYINSEQNYLPDSISRGASSESWTNSTTFVHEILPARVIEFKTSVVASLYEPGHIPALYVRGFQPTKGKSRRSTKAAHVTRQCLGQDLISLGEYDLKRNALKVDNVANGTAHCTGKLKIVEGFDDTRYTVPLSNMAIITRDNERIEATVPTYSAATSLEIVILKVCRTGAEVDVILPGPLPSCPLWATIAQKTIPLSDGSIKIRVTREKVLGGESEDYKPAGARTQNPVQVRGKSLSLADLFAIPPSMDYDEVLELFLKKGAHQPTRNMLHRFGNFVQKVHGTEIVDVACPGNEKRLEELIIEFRFRLEQETKSKRRANGDTTEVWRYTSDTINSYIFHLRKGLLVLKMFITDKKSLLTTEELEQLVQLRAAVIRCTLSESSETQKFAISTSAIRFLAAREIEELKALVQEGTTKKKALQKLNKVRRRIAMMSSMYNLGCRAASLAAVKTHQIEVSKSGDVTVTLDKVKNQQGRPTSYMIPRNVWELGTLHDYLNDAVQRAKEGGKEFIFSNGGEAQSVSNALNTMFRDYNEKIKQSDHKNASKFRVFKMTAHGLRAGRAKEIAQHPDATVRVSAQGMGLWKDVKAMNLDYLTKPLLTFEEREVLSPMELEGWVLGHFPDETPSTREGEPSHVSVPRRQ